MERSAAFIPDATSSSVQASRPPASGRAPDLPGCESFHLPESALDDYDGRFEFWDGRTETAWKVADAVAATLRLRGIDVPDDLAEALQRIPDIPLDVVLAAALACTDAGDFRRRLREAAGTPRR